MITAIDTNVLLDVVLRNAFDLKSSAALEACAALGPLVICEPVYAELSVQFESQGECDSFLADLDIGVENLSRTSLLRAGRDWLEYRRRGGQRSRILSDFFIGAHAEVQASRLLTRDRGFYKQTYPTLEVIDPSDGA